jgi:transposase
VPSKHLYLDLAVIYSIFLFMYVRIKNTPNSPRKSVQIVQSLRVGDKVVQKIVQHVGIALDDTELEQLQVLANSIKDKLEQGNQTMLFAPEEMAKKVDNTSASPEDEHDFKVDLKDLVEEDRVISGIHDIYGKLFDEIGFDRVIKSPKRNASTVQYFKDIVLARIANPRSKMASIDMLEENFGISLDLHRVYKMMDALDDEAISRLNDISYKTTCLFKDKMDVVFFDCTTLYFESFKEDGFRENGFSKDLKFNQPQVLLALMVTKEGLPVGYQAFEGSKYEGHTLLPAIKELRRKYQLNKVVFVADSGLFNKDNLEGIEQMESDEIEYIVGSRLKSLPQTLKNEILDISKYTKVNEEYKIGRFVHNGRILIVSYSAKRARKDSHDREKALIKLKAKLEKVKDIKGYMSNFGYKKYLTSAGKTSFILDEKRIEEDAKWDGLHGVVTNAKDLSNEEILKQYRNLWQVEYAFRVTKHDLKIRPVYHWKKERVKAHLAISYAAFSLVKFLEYRVKLQYKQLSPEKIREHLLRVQTSILYDKKQKIRFGFPSRISQEAKKIYSLMKVSSARSAYVIKKL